MAEEQQEKVKEETPVEEAQRTIRELRAERAELQKTIDDLQQAAATLTVSGKAEAGKPDAPPPEETPQEYAKRVERGDI